MSIDPYRASLERELRAGKTTEHTFRPALKVLIEALAPGIAAQNEPGRAKYGAPDYRIYTSAGATPLTIGYVEAKDIGENLGEIEGSSQLLRYRDAVENLILTDYLEFRWYLQGERRDVARLARLVGGRLVPEQGGDAAVVDLLRAFLARTPEPVRKPRDLAEGLAQPARMIRAVITDTFRANGASPLLKELLDNFRKALVPNLTHDELADMLAQTLAYGLFAARVNHVGIAPFSRRDARYEVPASNPFLRSLFDRITGPDLEDEPFAGFVDDLVYVLAHADIDAVLVGFADGTSREDPVVHFYETFLKAYDPEVRDLRGVYYTPTAVVSYIVRSVDAVLGTHLGLPQGLADTSTLMVPTPDGEGLVERPRLLILDPATGTGTFPYAVIGHIRDTFMANGDAGLWQPYVHEHLLPRLAGFELLMAPYTVAHLKLGMRLAGLDLAPDQRPAWAYQFTRGDRLQIYLTNTLDEAAPSDDALIAGFLADEARAAGQIKRNWPIMVVLGNPPYKGHSANPSIIRRLERDSRNRERLVEEKTAIGQLLDDYHRVDGQSLGERNPKWLQNDYVKFIRFGQDRVQKTGSGVLAFITDNSYLDKPTFRGMRQQLMSTFTDIYILDLHGNSLRPDYPPAGQRNENVFDIQQGVAIALFVRRPGVDTPAQVHYHERWGTREEKYSFLSSVDLTTTPWQEIRPISPLYMFVPSDSVAEKDYGRGWALDDIMPLHVLGFQSHRDHFAIDFDRQVLRDRVGQLHDDKKTDDELRLAYELKDNRDWHLATARRTLQSDSAWESHLRLCSYRPFDKRWCFYNIAAMDYPRSELQQHMLGENLSLNTTRQTSAATWRHVLVADTPTPAVLLEIKDGSSAFPLYLYPARGEGVVSTATMQDRELDDLTAAAQQGRIPPNELTARQNAIRDAVTDLFPFASYPRWPNFRVGFLATMASRTGLRFLAEGGGDLETTFDARQVFAYIYALLHASTYRIRFAEPLKRGYPRIFIGTDVARFAQMVGLGEKLIETHLLAPGPSVPPIPFPVPGSRLVAPKHPRYVAPTEQALGRVYINAEGGGQYFDGVDEAVWAFVIGNYQICERWIADRRGRQLTVQEIVHFRQLVGTIQRTIDLIERIDEALPDVPA